MVGPSPSPRWLATASKESCMAWWVATRLFGSSIKMTGGGVVQCIIFITTSWLTQGKAVPWLQKFRALAHRVCEHALSSWSKRKAGIQDSKGSNILYFIFYWRGVFLASLVLLCWCLKQSNPRKRERRNFGEVAKFDIICLFLHGNQKIGWIYK